MSEKTGIQETRILLIDDDPLALRIVGRVLQDAGLQVKELPTPIGATRLVLRGEVDAVVMDFNMPALRGDKLARLLRRNPRMQTLPIVIVSGESREVLTKALSDLPNVSFVQKAHVKTQLVPTLTAAFRGGQTGGQSAAG